MSTAGKKRFGPDMSPAVVAKAMAFIEQNIHRCLSLDDVAGAVGYSKFQFHKDFVAATGVTVKDAITTRQIEVAKSNMLAGMPLAKVARQSGFATHSYFAERFRTFTGQTPTDWLKEEAARRADRGTGSQLPDDWPEWCAARKLAARWGVSRTTIHWFHNTDGLGVMRDGRLIVHRSEVDAAERRAATFKTFRFVRAKKVPPPRKPRKE